MLICLDPHALCYMPCFPMLFFLFLLYVNVRVTCSHACMMLLAMPCLDLCILCVYIHAIWLDPCLHMLICLDSCSSTFMCQVSTCLCTHFYAYMSKAIFSHAYVIGSMFSTCFMLSSMCLCASHLVYVLRPCAILALVCHAMCYFSHFIPFYRIFLCFGLMVRTRSRPYGLCHRPYTKAHIKGFRSSYLHVYACLLLCFMLMLTSLI